MNYALAKELKDAGFPEPTHCDCSFSQLNGGYYAPSLSELIEACGLKFGSLNRYGDVWDAEPPADDITHGAWSGDTPEEAVARLWLALNKP